MNCAAQFTGLTLSPRLCFLYGCFHRTYKPLTACLSAEVPTAKCPAKKQSALRSVASALAATFHINKPNIFYNASKLTLLAQSFGALSKGLE